MAVTNKFLRDAVLGGDPVLHKCVQNLLLAASKAFKYRNSSSRTMFGLGENKAEKYLNDTMQVLALITRHVGGIEEAQSLIAITKDIYLNWQDAYSVIDYIFEAARDNQT